MGTSRDVVPEPAGIAPKLACFQVPGPDVAIAPETASHAGLSLRSGEPTTRLSCRRSWVRVPSSALFLPKPARRGHRESAFEPYALPQATFDAIIATGSPVNVKGTNLIRFIAVLAGTAAFAYLYIRWMKETWDAVEDPPTPPKPNPDDVKIATGLAGALGGLFAVAMGIKAHTFVGNRVAKAGAGLAKVGETLTGTTSWVLAVPATLAVWTYFLVGLGAAATWEWNKPVTPPSVKTLAEVIGGYILALILAQAAAGGGGSERVDTLPG